MEKKLWYAVMRDREDNDWGYGSFNLNKAIKMADKDNYPEAYIAVIDANYDEDGNPTTDGECVEEMEIPRTVTVKDYGWNVTVWLGDDWASIDHEDYEDFDEDENTEGVREELKLKFEDITEEELDAIIEKLKIWISVNSGSVSSFGKQED